MAASSPAEENKFHCYPIYVTKRSIINSSSGNIFDGLVADPFEPLPPSTVGLPPTTGTRGY